MIAVIADDFTGAAEIGGVGLRRGLATVIGTNVANAEKNDLVIISADTRSVPPEVSGIEIARITRELMILRPSFIFKKLDSVLRGNVKEELIAQMEASGKKKAIVIAGNPHLGRIIMNGQYYINGVPVNQTSFAKDPVFPVRSAIVTEMIGGKKCDVISLPVNHKIPEKGLIFGDVVNETDLSYWAGILDEDSVPAGGAGFFEVLLDKQISHPEISTRVPYHLGKRILFVLGSAYPKNPEEIFHFQDKGFTFLNIPEALYSKAGEKEILAGIWSDGVCKVLAENGKVVISVNPALRKNVPLSLRIRESIGMVVRKIFDKISIDDLLIEGGDTTSVILKYLGISKLYPFRELDRGVIQMHVEKYPDLCITTKPGSYSWPECLIINGENCQEERVILK